ncbi:MAG: NAD-dependent epimerase/dehydratase family protein [Thermoplasmata archaeon]|nr:MAG: NAD-dependent epimerase/dehydratase family protein [Thermoplasmata archaeon]
MPKKISVLITGPTGTAGSGVLQACLKHPTVKKVSALTRRTTGIKNKKLVEIIHDEFLNYTKIKDKLTDLDACYWCIGVSQMDVRDEADYYRITYEYTMEAAKVLEKLNPGMTFCFISGAGTKQNGRMMWARIKGKAEADLAKFSFKSYNFRPAFIHPIKGRKSQYKSARILYPFIKNSKRLCVEADELGLAMINATLFGYEKHTLSNPDIRELAKRTK